MAKDTKKVEEKETKQYKVKELVEGIRTYFPLGVVTDTKDGKAVPRFLRKVLTDDKKIDDKSVLFVTLYIAGDQDKNETANFIDFAISVGLAKKVKEAGIDLKTKGKIPVKLRYTITQSYSEEKGNQTLKEITNVGIKNGDTWEWVIKPKKADGEAKDGGNNDGGKKAVVNDSDLPF